MLYINKTKEIEGERLSTAMDLFRSNITKLLGAPVICRH